MKQKQLIAKNIVVAALVLAGSSSAYAQFGNVLNRAKNAVKRETVKQANDAQWKAKSKVSNEIHETVRGEREKAKAAAEEAASEVTGEAVTPSGSKEGISVWYGSDNYLVGTYYPDRQQFELSSIHKDGPNEGKPITYTFNADGDIMGDDGNKKGEIKGDMVSSGNVYNMEVRSDGNVVWEGEEMGDITPDGHVTLFHSNIARTSEPMDSKILAFCVYGVLYKTDKLRELRKSSSDDLLGGYTVKRTVVTKPSGSSSSDGETILYRGGTIVGKIKADGTVYVNGSIKGQIRSGGQIYVGGSNSGTLRSNGDVLKGGSIIGRIESNGNVRIKGSVVGKVESNGDIRRGGSIIGKAKNMSNMKNVAIFYFFGFY